MLQISLSLFQLAQAATIILAMLILVLLVDAFSAWIRQRWISL
jgi:phosphonate transport system permease protein